MTQCIKYLIPMVYLHTIFYSLMSLLTVFGKQFCESSLNSEKTKTFKLITDKQVCPYDYKNCSINLKILYCPVWPKPPAPRQDSSRCSTSTNSALTTGWTTNCAILMPLSTANFFLPKLHKITPISPR